MEFEKFSAEEFAANGSFIRWIRGSDPEVNWFWESFLRNYPHKAKEIEKAKEIVSLLQFQHEDLTDTDISSMKNRILMAVYQEKGMLTEDLGDSKKDNEKQQKNHWLRWVAIIAFPLAFLSVFYLLTNKADDKNSLVFFKRDANKIENYINPKGKKAVLLLSDGTKVWLNAGSQLDYSNDFETTDAREVYLTGEAFFDVTPNPNRPFIVHTAGITVRVLGTAFNIKSYPEDKTIETTLVHGEVRINKKGEDPNDGSLVLKPNQRAIFAKASNTVNVEQVLAERAASWKSGKLIFEETPFADVIVQLERWYDVKIRTEQHGELKCRLTAEIENEKLEDVLKLLEVSHQVIWTISGKDVFIKGIRCK